MARSMRIAAKDRIRNEHYTGMDKTCLYTSSGSLFVILSVGMSNVHVTSNVIITG